MKNSLIVLSLLMILININYGQKYDLNEFIELVKKNNKDILIAAKDLEIAETEDAIARSGAYPNISATGGYKRNLKEAFMYFDASELFGPGAGSGTPSKFKINYKNEFSASTTVKQQIFNFSVFNAIKAAKQYQKLTQYVFDATQRGIVNGSKKAFYQTLLLKEIWDVNKKSENNAHDNYLDLKKKFETGLISEFALLQAEVRWQNYLPKLTQSERNYLLALNSLKTLAGVNIEENFEIVGQLEANPQMPSMIEMADVFKNRPDYNAMIWEKKLRESNVAVESSGHLPSLSANLVYQYSALSDEFKFERENNYFIAGLNLNIPIFSGGMTSARVQKAQIEVNQADLKISKFKSEIFTEIKNLDLKLKEAENRILSAKSTLKTAQKAFSIAEITFDNGLATQLELKDARLGYDQAQLNYYGAVYEYLESYFDWELAVGMVN